MIRHESDPSLAEELPFWEFVNSEKSHVVLSDGSIVGGLDVGLTDIECFDDRAVNSFTMALRSALNSLAEDITVQFYMTVDSDFTEMLSNHSARKKSNSHELIKAIALYREKVLEKELNDGYLYRPKLKIFLKVPLPNLKKLSALKKKSHFEEISNEAYNESIELLTQNTDALQSSFSSLGIESKKMSHNDLVKVVYRFLNPKRSLNEPAPSIVLHPEESLRIEEVTEPWLADETTRGKLAFGDLILGFEQFTLDSHYHRVITLKTMPEVTYAGQLLQFLRMPFHYDLLLTVDVPPQANEMAKLLQKRKMAHSLAATQGNRASDLESESKLNSTEELIRELLNTGQRIYAAQFTIILRAPANLDGAKRLNRQVREVLAKFRSLQGAEGLEETVGAWKIVKGNLPAAPVSLERAKKFKTNNLADFIPLYGPRLGDDDPVVLFRNRLNGLVSYDPFDKHLSNYNTLVTGSSGAGKSFLNNCILAQELSRDLRVFIIDIGGSYKKLTHALNGQYLEINLNDTNSINPLEISDLVSGPSDQKLKSLLAIIESMIVDEDRPKLPKLEKVLLEKEIIELYKLKAKENVSPLLSDLKGVLEKSSEPCLQQIGKLLYMWTGDTAYGRLLDRPGSLRTNSEICTFDLKGLSSYPDLQSVMILLLTDFIIGQVEGNRTQRKRIILDEAWALLKSNAAAGFMEYCARTLRKTGSGITFITQGVEEIASSPIGSAILNNTATKFIMLQRGDSNILKETLKLNDEELRLIYSLEQKKGEFSEGFMIEGDHRQVVRIYPTPFEYWVSTSDAFDNAFLDKLMNGGMSLIQAIQSAANDFPSGVGQKRKEDT
jgi:conjugal transfer ATP-binding protein TraC